MVFTRRNLDWWCERGILSLLLAMLVFGPLAFGAIYAWTFLVLQALAVGGVCSLGVRLWASSRPKIFWPPLAWVVLAFMVYAIGRYLTADIEYVARLELIQVLMFGFIFFAVVNNFYGQDETQVISFTLIAVATLIAGYAAMQLLTNSNHVWNLVAPIDGRAMGTYISPNKLAGFLEMLLPLALAYLLVGRVSIMTRILLAYAAVAIAVGLATTLSRGGWLAAGAGVALVLGILLGHRNHRLRAALLLAIMLVGGGLFVKGYLAKTVGYMQRVMRPETGGPGVVDTNSRLEMWNAAVQMWRDNFWWGVGPAHYDYRFREYRPEDFQLRPDRAHNDYLNLLADWGTVGGVIVAAGIVVFIFGLIKSWSHVRRPENDFGNGQSSRFAFFLGAVGGLFALAVHSTVDFNLHMPANALTGVVLLALVASNLRFATEGHWFRLKPPGQLALTVGLAGVTAYLVAQGWRRGGETLWQARGEQWQNFSTERATRWAQAYACEPNNSQMAYDIGECYRTQSLEGGENYAALAQQAMDWYARGIKANPHDGYNFLRTGMCLDWLDRHAEAEPYYAQAETRDPNGYFMVANIGWHYVQTGDYAAARQWFARSLKLSSKSQTAHNYLYQVCQPKLEEMASGRPSPLRVFDKKKIDKLGGG